MGKIRSKLIASALSIAMVVGYVPSFGVGNVRAETQTWVEKAKGNIIKISAKDANRIIIGDYAAITFPIETEDYSVFADETGALNISVSEGSSAIEGVAIQMDENLKVSRVSCNANLLISSDDDQSSGEAKCLKADSIQAGGELSIQNVDLEISGKDIELDEERNMIGAIQASGSIEIKDSNVAVSGGENAIASIAGGVEINNSTVTIEAEPIEEGAEAGKDEIAIPGAAVEALKDINVKNSVVTVDNSQNGVSSITGNISAEGSTINASVEGGALSAGGENISSEAGVDDSGAGVDDSGEGSDGGSIILDDSDVVIASNGSDEDVPCVGAMNNIVISSSTMTVDNKGDSWAFVSLRGEAYWKKSSFNVQSNGKALYSYNFSAINSKAKFDVTPKLKGVARIKFFVRNKLDLQKCKPMKGKKIVKKIINKGGLPKAIKNKGTLDDESDEEVVWAIVDEDGESFPEEIEIIVDESEDDRSSNDNNDGITSDDQNADSDDVTEINNDDDDLNDLDEVIDNKDDEVTDNTEEQNGNDIPIDSNTPEETKNLTPTEEPAVTAGPTYKNEWVKGQWYDKDGGTSYPHQGSWTFTPGIGWWFGDTNGWYPTSQWQKIDGFWYFFDSTSYMAIDEYCSSWGGNDADYWYVDTNGQWDGSPAAHWCLSKEKKWWFGDSKNWFAANRWLKIKSIWYHFDENGLLDTDKEIDGFYVNGDGAWTP